MKYLGSKYIVTDRLELKPQTMEEQKYLWELLMLPDVNRYFLTVPTKFREKLKDWNKQKDFMIKILNMLMIKIYLGGVYSLKVQIIVLEEYHVMKEKMKMKI